jgi:hypothetical protein
MIWDRKYDGVIFLGARRAKGLWANQLQTFGTPVVRNGGRWNSSASNHSLLAVAAISGLRSITNKMAAEIVNKRKDGRTRPSLLVKATDATFLPALEALIKRQDGPQLKVIRSLHKSLAHQISRFQLSFALEEQCPPIAAVLDWAAHNVLPPADFSDWSPALMPSAVNVRESLFSRGIRQPTSA